MAAILSLNSATSWFLIFTLFVWTKRIFWTLRFRTVNPPLEPVLKSPEPAPKISVIVPARNEEKNIENCLSHLLKQNYSHYEIIVVNDRSVDQTSELVAKAAAGAAVPVKEVRIPTLPAGWTGKNHAMLVGAKTAECEWICFTDADTTHQNFSLQTALATALEQNIYFLTLAPETESHSFWEKVVQPLAVGSLALWFDAVKVNDPRSRFTLANGQFILVQKKVYDAVGGNESVKNEVVEDVELAKKIKDAGFCVRFLNGTKLYSTRMYSSLKEIKTGWTRIFTYLFEKRIPPILGKIASLFFFSILPFGIFSAETILKFAAGPAFDPTVWVLSGAVCLWIFFIRFFGNRLLRTNPWTAALHPLGALILIWILLCCLGRIIWKRPSVWRGDQYA
jgi:chlorobactene glucosyltransferase